MKCDKSVIKSSTKTSFFDPKVVKCPSHLEVLRFIQRNLQDGHGVILIGIRDDFLTIICTFCVASTQKIAILTKFSNKNKWQEVLREVTTNVFVVTELAETFDVVVCDDRRHGVPRGTVFLWDQVIDGDLFDHHEELYDMIRTLGVELRYKECESFVKEFGRKKKRLKLFCNRFTYKISSKQLAPKPPVVVHSESSSDVPFASSDIETQMPGPSSLRQICYPEVNTQEMDSLIVEGKNVYDEDTVEWFPPDMFTPEKDKPPKKDTKDPEKAFPTVSDDKPSSPTENYCKELEAVKPQCSTTEAEDSDDSFCPNSQIPESRPVKKEFSKKQSSSEDNFLSTFHNTESRFELNDAQDPSAPSDSDAHLDPYRYVSFVENVPSRPKSPLKSQISQKSGEAVEIKSDPQVIVISSSSGSSGKRAATPDLFTEDSDEELGFLSIPEMKKRRTISRDKDSTPTPPPPKSPSSPSALWSTQKEMEMFEITRNDVFAHIICQHLDGDMSPLGNDGQLPPNEFGLKRITVDHSDDDEVQSSQPISLRTPKRRTRPVMTRVSSRRRIAATGGWLNKDTEVSPQSPRSPKTPASRKRLFANKGNELPEHESILSPDLFDNC